MTATAAAPVLHMPEEPTVRAERWLSAVLDGAALDDVLAGDDGVVGLALVPLAHPRLGRDDS